MKDASLRIQSLIAAFILLALTALSAKAQETGAEFLSDLHDFRVNNYLALDAFYNFSATGHTETLNRIVVGINNSNDAMNSVVASTSGVLSEQQVEELNQAFDQFKNLMRGLGLGKISWLDYQLGRAAIDAIGRAVRFVLPSSHSF